MIITFGLTSSLFITSLAGFVMISAGTLRRTLLTPEQAAVTTCTADHQVSSPKYSSLSNEHLLHLQLQNQRRPTPTSSPSLLHLNQPDSWGPGSGKNQVTTATIRDTTRWIGLSEACSPLDAPCIPSQHKSPDCICARESVFSGSGCRTAFLKRLELNSV